MSATVSQPSNIATMDAHNVTSATMDEKPKPSADTISTTNTTGATNNVLPSPALNTKHQLFCQIVGILPYQTEQPMAESDLVLFPKSARSKPSGLYPRVVRAYRYHTLQYWFVATLSNVLLWTQLVLGATLAALGGSSIDTSRQAAKDLATGVTVLSAVQTVIGGLIIYFKSRNQPNRARQFRNSLKDVKSAIENTEAMFRDVNCKWDVTERVTALSAACDAAVKTAETNYPDLWVGAQPGPPAVAPPPVDGGSGGELVSASGTRGATA